MLLVEEICQNKVLYTFFFFGHAVWHAGFLVPPTRDQTTPSAVKAWSPDHWTAREFQNKILNTASMVFNNGSKL